MEDKNKFIQATCPLDDGQFRVLILTLLNKEPETIKRHITSNLFSEFKTDRENCEYIISDIEQTLGMERIEQTCKSFNLSILDTKKVCDLLGLKDLDELADEVDMI